MKANNWYLTLTIATIITAIGLGAASAASKESSSSTPQQVFDGMRQSFQAQKAKGVHARYQWELSGPNGGEWWIDVNDGTYKMGRGKIDKVKRNAGVIHVHQPEGPAKMGEREKFGDVSDCFW